MAEPGITAETYRAASPMVAGKVTLLPIEHTVVHAVRAGHGVWCWSDKAPHAVLIHDGGRWRAVDADGLPVPLDGLLTVVPGLDALLASA